MCEKFHLVCFLLLSKTEYSLCRQDEVSLFFWVSPFLPDSFKQQQKKNSPRKQGESFIARKWKRKFKFRIKATQ